MPQTSLTPYLCIRLSAFAAVSLALFYFIIKPSSVSRPWKSRPGGTVPSGSAKCSPKDWSAGMWIRKESPVVVSKPDDVYAASGFKGCASNREVPWHLANDHPDDLPWRGNISAYDWVPASACNDMETNFQESMVIDLVEKGGWLLIGDYSKGWDFDRAWPQHLYLSPHSPLVSRIKFPEGFNMTKTPLVSFRRNDLLFNATEVESMFNGGGWRPGPGENSTLFGKEQSWNISPTEYLNDLFFRPLPDANYQSLIVSTAGHWSLKLLAGLPNGYTDIYDLFRVVITNFVYQAARELDLHSANGKQREVIVRPYMPGDDNCHAHEVMYGGPLKEVPNIQHASYNWAWIPHLNGLSKKAVEDRAHPHVTYADIDRPGRLRPDSHVLGDCLHITIGAGVIEGWTKYLHYYIGTYLPWYRASTKLPGYPISDRFRR
ncbi:hypothetical protein FRB90_012359 [Tulasnella sp. 427]|nr:hypothetical protein FRB90_012359 [Tulasnella sp. 427]